MFGTSKLFVADAKDVFALLKGQKALAPGEEPTTAVMRRSKAAASSDCLPLREWPVMLTWTDSNTKRHKSRFEQQMENRFEHQRARQIQIRAHLDLGTRT